MKKSPSQRNSEMIRELLAFHKEKKEAIRKRLEEFSRVSPNDYFYELLYCLMTPQSSAENAEKAVALLRQLDFEQNVLDPESVLRNKHHYIRFHRTKAKHLLKAKEDLPSLLQALRDGSSSLELREWTVRHIKGLGYKEATHFLRNIGKNDGLAILDRHILRNLKRYGAIRSIPRTISRKQYFRIEQRFIEFSQRIDIPLDELDLLFWSLETGEIRK